MAWNTVWKCFVFASVAHVSYVLYEQQQQGGYNDWSTTLNAMTLLVVENLVMFCDVIGLNSPAIFRRILKATHASAELETHPNVTFYDTIFEDVPVRVYTPVSASTARVTSGRPAIVTFHGGGWTIGSIDDLHRESLTFAAELNSVVVAVRYRLAPEHKAPAAFQDSLTATKFFITNAHEFGVDPGRIALKGQSVGATLAASVTIALLKERFQRQPKLLVLINGLYQAASLNTPSYQFNQQNAFQTKRMTSWFIGNYVFGAQTFYYELMNCDYIGAHSDSKLGHVMSRDLLPLDEIRDSYDALSFVDSEQCRQFYEQWFDELLSDSDTTRFPLMTSHKHLRAFPKTYIYTCQYDVLRDDGLFFAHALRRAGNDVIEIKVQDCHHLWYIIPSELQQTLFRNLLNSLAQEL